MSSMAGSGGHIRGEYSDQEELALLLRGKTRQDAGISPDRRLEMHESSSKPLTLQGPRSVYGDDIATACNVLSEEDCRATQRLQACGSLGWGGADDRRNIIAREEKGHNIVNAFWNEEKLLSSPNFPMNWASVQRPEVGGILSGAAYSRNMNSRREEGSRSHFLQQSSEKGKMAVSRELSEEGDSQFWLPLGHRATSVNHLQHGQKRVTAFAEKHVAQMPISWSAVAEAFVAPILACPPGWQSINGITDQEASEMAKDPMYIQYLKVASYTTHVVASYTDHSFNMDANIPHNLLEEVKSNTSSCIELSDIVGYLVEFSSDQFGSRFIQHKLETATIDEKNMVFREIQPRVLTMMTDVFGNYVIQKFLENGTTAQKMELTNHIKGRVVQLSLEMFGCRVVQKAIENVKMEQKIRIASELHGHVMVCVKDQNGNHVIQKCIECIQHEKIHFIISTFYNQVAKLSIHPYGSRVIQKLLEHLKDPRSKFIIVNEVIQSVSSLALDKYGNYVVQHVLENGKPEERSLIVKKLAGQIVHMSIQKFSSNVIEKCLTFGGPEDRELLIKEMLGYTYKNEPLQAMMKDRYGNFVVQKALEFCNNQQCRLILSRIKLHLRRVEKYMFGKHIVSRIEKLIEVGERRIRARSS